MRAGNGKAKPGAAAPTAPPIPGAVRVLLVLFPLLAGLYVLAIGQDANWDLRNYHFYNPFAYLTGRMGHDVAVAHVATYYNPLLHLPFYWAVESLPPRVVGFLLGLIAGLNVFWLYAIATRAAGGLDRPWIPWFALTAALAGVSGHNGISELGTSYGDNILSLLVLAAVWLILRFREKIATPGATAWAIVLAAGVLAGSAFGMKLPFALYCVGLCVAFFGLPMPAVRRFQMAFGFGLGVLSGALLTGGFWMLEMYERFANPLFPYFNEVFQSPWAAAASYRDERFLPSGVMDWLFYPLRFTINPMQVGEIVFRDFRFAAVYALIIGVLGHRVYRSFKPAAPPGAGRPEKTDRTGISRFLVIFTVVSFLVWMKLFGVYRYIIVCEQLAPIVIWLLLAALVREPRRLVGLATALIVLILVTSKPGDWGRRPWSTDYFGFTPPPIAEPDRTVVLVTGHDPVAYMIPFFPPGVRFLRIHGYMTGPSATPGLIDRSMREAIDGHRGALYLLYRSYEAPAAFDTLKAYGLRLYREPCLELTAAVEPQPEYPFYFCEVKKN